MKRSAFLLGSALSLGGALLLCAGPAEAQASACSAEIMYTQQALNSMPVTPIQSRIKPGITTPRTDRAGVGSVATPQGTRLGQRVGERLGENLGESVSQRQSPSANAGGLRRSAHAVPSGSGEAYSPGALPGASDRFIGQRYYTAAPGRTGRVNEDERRYGAAMPGGSTNAARAAAALAQARIFDQAGDNSACMRAVREARRYLR
jgi:hypothetical protein